MKKMAELRKLTVENLRAAALIIGVGLSLLGLATAPVHSAEPIITYFFWSEGCPHCEKEKVFLEQMKKRYPQLEVQSFEVKKNPDNAALFARMGTEYGLTLKGVPATFVGGLSPVVGFRGNETSGIEIEEKIRYCAEYSCNDPLTRRETAVLPDLIGNLASPGSEEGLCKQDEECPEGPLQKPADQIDNLITLPLIGTIDSTKTALSYQTLIIAGLDSFNPCAFFVLFTLLGLLLHAHSRKRMLFIGGTFVFFSGFIYFIFMAAWLNIFLLTGQIAAITAVAGIIALVIALINIKDFFFFKQGVSLSIPDSAKPKLFDRMRKLLAAKSFAAVVTGTVVLAVAANAYELFCTAGFPMVYTRILTLHNLSKTSYYLYLVLYNLIYVVPLSIIVLFFAITLGSRKLSEWQGQVLKLISGMMMLCLGILLVGKTELLNNIKVTSGLLASALLLSAVIAYVTKRLARS